MLKLTTDRHETSRGPFATAELFVHLNIQCGPKKQTILLSVVHVYFCYFTTVRFDLVLVLYKLQFGGLELLLALVLTFCFDSHPVHCKQR